MKNLTSFLGLMIYYVSFSQDIDFTKTKQNINPDVKKYPFEFTLSYGITYNLSDTINDKNTYPHNLYGSIIPSDTTIYKSFVIDSVGLTNNSFNVGVRKRFNKIRLGVNFNYLTSSFSKQDFFKDKIVFYPSTASIETDYLYSSTEFKMNSYRLNIQLDYIFFEKKNTNIYLGIGLGYSNTTLNSNSKYGQKSTKTLSSGSKEITYDNRDTWKKFTNNTIFLLPSFGLDHKFNSRIKANINFSLYLPFSSYLNRSGSNKSYYSWEPFKGNWNLIDDDINNSDYMNILSSDGTGEVGEQISSHIYSLKNPIQIGFNIGIIYSLK